MSWTARGRARATKTVCPVGVPVTSRLLGGGPVPQIVLADSEGSNRTEAHARIGPTLRSRVELFGPRIRLTFARAARLLIHADTQSGHLSQLSVYCCSRSALAYNAYCVLSENQLTATCRWYWCAPVCAGVYQCPSRGLRRTECSLGRLFLCVNLHPSRWRPCFFRRTRDGVLYSA